MAEILEVDLLHGEHSNVVAGIVRDVDIVGDVLSWYTDWLPEMYDFSQKPIYEDSHWTVPEYWEFSAKNKNDRALVIECENRIQGFVILKLHDYKGIEGDSCTHVKFIASAPWNRKKQLTNKRLFHKTGKMLLAVSIVVGHWANKNGAIELESMPGAEGFYRKHGLLPTGKEKNGMLQYRLTHSAAITLFEEVKGSIRARRKQ